jgi:hypothetical protein
MTALHFLGAEQCARFPREHELHRLGRRLESEPEHLTPFLERAWGATKRLWILDLHFYPHGYFGLKQVLSLARVTDVRVMCEDLKHEHQPVLKELRRLAECVWNVGRVKGVPHPPAPTRIQLVDRLVRKAFPFAHDRFAIVDDDLWHFGAASCGSGNTLSAATGPWSAIETEAVEFFEMIGQRVPYEPR